MIRTDYPNQEEVRQALLLSLESNFLHGDYGARLRELHRHLSYAIGDKSWMLVMLRHLDPKHHFFSKGYQSRQKLQRVTDADHVDKKDIMRKFQSDLEGMPTLKGSNPRAKTSVYNALNKPKKATRKEALARRPDFQALLAQDEL